VEVEAAGGAGITEVAVVSFHLLLSWDGEEVTVEAVDLAVVAEAISADLVEAILVVVVQEESGKSSIGLF
jgi:hypothetical protein